MNKKMLWMAITLVVIAVVTAPVAACACKVTGIGHIKGLDGLTFASFGGNAMPLKDGILIKGEWNHVDHVTGDHFHGDVSWISCFTDPDKPGPDVPDASPLNYANFGGTGTLNGVGVCTFNVLAQDINEGGIHRDGYEIYVQCADGRILSNKATSDACLYLPLPEPTLTPIGCLAGGNFQIHPSNAGHPYSI